VPVGNRHPPAAPAILGGPTRWRLGRWGVAVDDQGRDRQGPRIEAIEHETRDAATVLIKPGKWDVDGPGNRPFRDVRTDGGRSLTREVEPAPLVVIESALWMGGGDGRIPDACVSSAPAGRSRSRPSTRAMAGGGTSGLPREGPPARATRHTRPLKPSPRCTMPAINNPINLAAAVVGDVLGKR
jgi:hypothetical protein